MASVWLVTGGNYPSECFHFGVYSTKEKAEAALEEGGAEKCRGFWRIPRSRSAAGGDYMVDEVELDADV